MTTRYTRKSLESLVNYANIVVPPCDGCRFKLYADGVGCAVRFTPVSGESWQRDIRWTFLLRAKRRSVSFLG